MDPILGAALVSAGSSIVGGLMNDDKGPTWKQQRRHAQQMADQDWNRQRYVLKNQLQWRAEDAKAAGIHPLAALGASSAMYSPAGGMNYVPQQDGGMGDALSAAGNSIAQGILAREQNKMNKEMHQAQIEQVKAQTATLNAQALNLTRNGVGSPNNLTEKTPTEEGGNPWDWLQKKLGLPAVEDSRTPDEDAWYLSLVGKLPDVAAQILGTSLANLGKYIDPTGAYLLRRAVEEAKNPTASAEYARRLKERVDGMARRERKGGGPFYSR